MSVTAAFPASEELTPIPPPRSKHKKEPSPIPPPRRKRANSQSPGKHRHNIGIETSNSSSCSNKDSTAAKRSGEPPKDMSSSTKKETNVAVTLLREEWMKDGSRSLPRIENYYTRDGPEMRRKTSAPLAQAANTVVVGSPVATTTTNAMEEKKAAVAEKAEESPTRSTRLSATGPTPKANPSSPRRPNKPPKPPAPAPYHSTRNKTAPYSQLYSGATDTQASRSTTTIVVIDSKAVADAGSERSLNMAPRTYGKMSGSRTKSGQGKLNRDDASIVYGKKTQAALNTLVAAMKRFQGSSQKTNPVRKSNANKTPPKRPPPAVRNTPHSKSGSDENLSCTTYSVNKSEDHPFVNLYDDHIYMEVGEKVFKSSIVTGATSRSAGLGLGLEEEDEDDYVIMNPGDNSHIYTPLTFHTRSNSTGAYDVLQVTRTGKKSTSIDGLDSLDEDDLYVSPEELKRYRVVTSVGDEEDSFSAIEDGKEAYESASYGKDDTNYETVNYYENEATAIAGRKQSSSGGKLCMSPTKSTTPTHRIVTDR